MTMRTILLTGSTGLVGRGVMARLLAADARLRIIALSRTPAPATHSGSDRVEVVRGDLHQPGLGMLPSVRRSLRGRIDAVCHLAADVRFSQSWEEARRTNVEGTFRILDLADEVGALRFVLASTAFAVGRATGAVEEGAIPRDGWVNAYERSKWEAEELVRASDLLWLILRPSTMVIDRPGGRVEQDNAIHRALRIYHRGLAPMLPGTEESTVDVVPSGFVCRAVADLTLREDLSGETIHLCAGAGALPLEEMLGRSHRVWSADPEWRRRCVSLPPVVPLALYRRLEATVAATGDRRLGRIIASLSHFLPQLAHPKRFSTGRAEALGHAAPPVRDYWDDVAREAVARERSGRRAA
jgi:2-alkyl-3-oxoalkanoate reductase